MSKDAPRRLQRKQFGFGLIEIMVGMVIGLLAVLVIYQVYTVAEGYKRNTTAAGEAQQSGLFAAFVLGTELGNAGSGIAAAGQDLAGCTDPGGAMPLRFAQSFRPIPVLITDGGGDANPDSFIVNYSMATTLANSALFTAAPLGANFSIQSPGGFHVNDLVVGIAVPGGNNNSPCGSSLVAAVSAPDGNGVVTITQTPVFPAALVGLSGSSLLFNFGPVSRAQKIMYQVCDQRAGCPQPPVCNQGTPCTLNSSPLLDANGSPAVQPPTPIVSNVVDLKIEYGIDANQTGVLSTWVQATTGGGWDPNALLPALLTTINQIKAVRIGIIVQSEQFDQTLAGFTGGNYVNGDYNWVLFDCASAIKANCPGRLTGTIAASVAPAPPGNWRFRQYETVIPLRNEIWNLNL